jgi:ABC-2 type transport system ATP-binding protein
VVIIAEGVIRYDGSLAGIVDRFGTHKVVTLQFPEDFEWGSPVGESLSHFGKLLDVQPPKAKLRIPRAEVTGVLAEILSQHAIEDVVVEDPPLEEVIAEIFMRAAASAEDVALNQGVA